MLLSIWNMIRGYVVIEVCGPAVERFINLAANKGLFIWDVRGALAGDCLEMKVSSRGFSLLYSCAEKSGCQINIVRKIGLPFIASRYKKRKTLMFGALFFIIAMYLLSSFIWLIEINGCTRLTAEAVAERCAESGFKAGALKHGMDMTRLEELLYDSFADISWVNARVKGTKLVIKLTETLPKPKVIDKSVACDIIARRDGLVTSIITSAGTPLVKQLDVVKKGDVLISGTLMYRDPATNEMTVSGAGYVHAEAEIWAKTYFEVNLEVPYEYAEKEYTGRTVTDYGLIVLDRDINLFKSGNIFMNYDKITSGNRLKFGESYPLPIVFVTTVNKEFKQVRRIRDIEQAKELAERLVIERVVREYDTDADIIDKALEFTDEGDRLSVKAIVTMLERIDEQSPLSY